MFINLLIFDGLFCLGIISKQFHFLKYGDRLYFENGHDADTRFSIKQIKEIKKIGFAHLICNNFGVKKISTSLFLPHATKGFQFKDCKHFPKIDLSLWKKKEPLSQNFE